MASNKNWKEGKRYSWRRGVLRCGGGVAGSGVRGQVESGVREGNWQRVGLEGWQRVGAREGD
jgi:hypothetical protein